MAQAEEMRARRWVGASVPRREDAALLRGQGSFTADIRLPGMVAVAFVRSPHAHARIDGIEVAAALAVPGVLGVFTAADLAELRPFPATATVPPAIAGYAQVESRTAPRRALAGDVVRYVGEPVAMVVAQDRYAAEDGRDAVTVHYAPLPAVVDPEQAMAPDAPRLYPDWPDNRCLRFGFQVGDVEAAFAQAAVVVEERVHTHRLTAVPMETRGVLATREPHSGRLTVYSSTQIPHEVRRFVAACLGLPEAAVRVVAPDVGGGFGPKDYVYPEEVAVPWLAWRLNRPVQWIEDRMEHFQATGHARDQWHTIAVAADADGRILGVRDHFVMDAGADNPFQLVVPFNTAAHLPGPYRVPTYQVRGEAVVTNKVPTVPYRGAGRPEAVFAMDRVLDRLAQRLGIDAVTVRRRNLLAGSEFPYRPGFLYRDGHPATYDSGDYLRAFETLLAACRLDAFREQQARLRTQGRYLGVGFSGYVEGTGIGPFEGAAVAVDDTGHVLVKTGSSPHGQGHQTVFAQLVADVFGVDPAAVTVVAGDTDAIAYGIGTFASRSAVVAGNGVWQAAQACLGKVKTVAAALLECAVEDVEVADGRVAVAGAPARALSLAEVAQAARPGRVPAGLEPGLEAVRYFVPPTVTMASGMHAAFVEVDAETGQVHCTRYLVVHDCGRTLNPLLAEGQVHGGVVQGLGGALCEGFFYDGDGQLLSVTFLDYLVIGAPEVPPLELLELNFPSPLNPLGVKGIGEGGAVSPAAAVAAAVEDALAPFGVVVRETPLTIDAVLTLLRQAQARERTVGA